MIYIQNVVSLIKCVTNALAKARLLQKYFVTNQCFLKIIFPHIEQQILPL